ncbi:hypothetical protein K7432_005727 [Basidiobolus ranarum]|uniref:JmjC domain-containing protein n=1 Tax=Basidiobolus ranarum TaxID=34480 RepID=A0ABR2W2Y7_9FUNG
MNSVNPCGTDRMDETLALLDYDKLINLPDSAFIPTPRINITSLSQEELIAKVESIVVQQGIPLIIENVVQGHKWDQELLSPEWLYKNYHDMEMAPRDMATKEDLQDWTLGKYLDYVAENNKESNPQKLYGKDVDCPSEWSDYVAKQLPSYFAYKGPNDVMPYLEEDLQPDNLMMYLGIGQTWTPGHADICASHGHNIMVSAEPDSSAFWFMAKTSDKINAAALWSKHASGVASIDSDNYFCPVSDLAKADFPVYVVEQKLGDFVLVPMESAHQVINKGGLNIKVSWNRSTATSIRFCFDHVLPLWRSILKPEVYRIRAMTQATMIAWATKISNNAESLLKLPKEELHRFLDDYKIILSVFKDMLTDDWIEERPDGLEYPPEISPDKLQHSRVCDFCKADIWNRWFYCRQCKDNPDTQIDEEDYSGYDICSKCYSEERTCVHSHNMVFIEHSSIKRCITQYTEAIEAFNNFIQGHESGYSSEILDFDFPLDLKGDKVSYMTIAYNMYSCRKKKEAPVYCHQCKALKNTTSMIWCGCGTKYCGQCYYNRYRENVYEHMRNRKWKCKKCLKQCNCAQCLRKLHKTHPVMVDTSESKDISSTESHSTLGNSGKPIYPEIMCTYPGDNPKSVGNILDERFIGRLSQHNRVLDLENIISKRKRAIDLIFTSVSTLDLI